MRIRIEGSDLPGRRPGGEADALRLGNVHVGVQRGAEVVDRVPADAPAATWAFEVASREVDGLLDVGGPFVHGRPGARFLYLSWGAVDDAGSATWSFDVTVREVDGLLDVAGPFVHGRPGARFLYLSWGAVDDGGFAMFRRAKLLFGDVPGDALRAAAAGAGELVGRLGLTDEHGGPRGARVRPPDIVWSVE